MILANLPVIQNPMVQEHILPHRVFPIPPLQQLQDCTQRKGSQSGEEELAKKKVKGKKVVANKSGVKSKPKPKAKKAPAKETKLAENRKKSN